MKSKIWIQGGLTGLVLAVSVAGLTIGCKKGEEGGVAQGGMKDVPAKQYTCTMHPEVISNAPGACPKCQMALVEKK